MKVRDKSFSFKFDRDLWRHLARVLVDFCYRRLGVDRGIIHLYSIVQIKIQIKAETQWFSCISSGFTLTRERFQLTNRFWLWHKINPKRWVPLTFLFEVIGILASGVVYTNKSNDGISSWDYAHWYIYLYVGYPEIFSPTECSLLEI